MVSRPEFSSKTSDKFKGARVTKSAADTSVDLSSETTLTYDTEYVDTDDFYTTDTTDTGKITVPSKYDGFYMQVEFQFNASSHTADNWARGTIEHYDSEDTLLHTSADEKEHGDTVIWLQARTGPVEGASGDYFLSKAQVEGDTDVTVTTDTRFSIEIGRPAP